MAKQPRITPKKEQKSSASPSKEEVKKPAPNVTVELSQEDISILRNGLELLNRQGCSMAVSSYYAQLGLKLMGFKIDEPK